MISSIQFPKMNMDCLSNKPNVNGVILKCFMSLGQTICQQRRLRSFRRGTVSFFRSKGCKVVVSKTLVMIPLSRTQTWAARVWFGLQPSGRVFFIFQTLTTCSFAFYWLTEIHNTSLERSNPLLLTYCPIKRLAVFFRLILPSQSDLIYIRLI